MGLGGLEEAAARIGGLVKTAACAKQGPKSHKIISVLFERINLCTMYRVLGGRVCASSVIF